LPATHLAKIGKTHRRAFLSHAKANPDTPRHPAGSKRRACRIQIVERGIELALAELEKRRRK